jgi:hypothetical protein
VVRILPSYRWCGANTHIDPSNRSLLLHKTPSVKSTPPSPPFHQEYAVANYQCSYYSGNIYYNCVFCFSSLFIVSWFTEMQCDVIYLETWVSTQPYVVFDTCILLWFLCFWRNTRGTEFSYIAWHVSVVPWVKSLKLAHGWGLFYLSWGLRSRHPLCLLYWSLTNVSANCRCGNLEPQQVRIIKLLSMVRSRRWKNSFFVHFQVRWLIEEELVMQSDLPTYPMCLL